MNGCSVAHHRFRFIGRCENDTVDGPQKGWLMWRSEEHEISREGTVCHWFTIAPDLFWVRKAS